MTDGWRQPHSLWGGFPVVDGPAGSLPACFFQSQALRIVKTGWACFSILTGFAVGCRLQCLSRFGATHRGPPHFCMSRFEIMSRTATGRRQALVWSGNGECRDDQPGFQPRKLPILGHGFATLQSTSFHQRMRGFGLEIPRYCQG